MSKRELKKNWEVDAENFQFLLEWLDQGIDSEGANYLEMRRRLVSFFDRKNCLTPETLADETLNRVARRLEETGEIESDAPAKFCYITARFVFLEHLRDAEKNTTSFEQAAFEPRAANIDFEARELKEKMLDCLERCTAQLETVSREIITNYYYGEERVKIENRCALAEKFGISANALTIRACRIRDKLEICVKDCAGIE